MQAALVYSKGERGNAIVSIGALRSSIVSIGALSAVRALLGCQPAKSANRPKVCRKGAYTALCAYRGPILLYAPYRRCIRNKALPAFAALCAVRAPIAPIGCPIGANNLQAIAQQLGALRSSNLVVNAWQWTTFACK